MPRRYEVDPTKGVLEIEWPLFGELSRALALKVAREYDPEIVIGVATAGVVPGAVVAAILDREFHSIMVSRRYRGETVRQTPAVMGAAPVEGRGHRVLIVDDLLATGGTAKAVVDLVEGLGGKVEGLLFVVELNFLKGREKFNGYNVKSLVSYDS